MKLAPQTNPPTSLSVGARKYSTEPRHELQQLVRTPTHISASSMPESLHSAFRGLINASVANSTWRKYTSAWRAFQAFEVDNEYTAEWPLDQPTVRAFATWCLTHRGLQPSTTQSYLSALRFAHHLQNLSLDGLNEDPVLDMIFAGARNIELANVSRPNTRRVVTFQLLLSPASPAQLGTPSPNSWYGLVAQSHSSLRPDWVSCLPARKNFLTQQLTFSGVISCSTRTTPPSYG